MSKNNLFQFIQSYVYKKPFQFKPNVFLVQDQNKYGKNYFRFELTTQPEQLELQDLKLNLTEHHISVYSSQNDDNPALSQYHYTATFTSEDGFPYILHTYFNDNDEPASDPVLSIQLNDNSLKPLDTPESHEVFLNLALTHTRPVLIDLRQRHKQKIEALEKEIFKLEEASTEAFKHDDVPTHLNILDKLTKAMQASHLLVKHDAYSAKCRFIQNMYMRLASMNKSVKKSTKNKKSNNSALQQNSLFAETVPIRQKAKPAHQKENPEHTIQQLFARFTNLNNHHDLDTYSSELVDLDLGCNEICLLFDLEELNLSKDCLNKINTMHVEIPRLADVLFHKLFSLKSIQTAEKLRHFYPLLNNQHLSKVLEENNSMALDFLLSFGDFSNINNMILNIHGKSWPSAVQFCYSKQDAACLSILIKHGASILVIGKSGLPLAYSILSENHHPLYSALDNNRPMTLHNTKFYRQLVADLEHYLKINDLNEIKTQQIRDNLKKYRLELNNPKLTIYGNDKRSQILNNQLSDLRNTVGRDLIEKLKQEPEIFALIQKIHQLTQDLYRQAPNQLKRQFKRMESEFLNVFHKKAHSLFEQAPDYETTISGVKTHLEQEVAMLEKCSELFETQSLIKRTPQNTKRGRQLAMNQSRLLAEVKEYSSREDSLFEMNFLSPEVQQCNEVLLSSLKKLQDLRDQVLESTMDLENTLEGKDIESEFESKFEGLGCPMQ